MELPGWVIDNLPPGWDAMPPTVPTDLPELSLIAFYRATRREPDSPAGRLAATLLLERYAIWVDRVIQRYSPEGQRSTYPGAAERERTASGVTNRLDNRQRNLHAQEIFQEGWRGFFEAVNAYDPSKGNSPAQRAIGLKSFAEPHIKRRIIEQIFRSLPRSAYSDDTRKVYKRTIQAWATLAQEWEREPSPEEVADHLAPHLARAFGTEARARRAILDVFETLRTDDPSFVEEPEEEEEGQGRSWAQVPSNFMQPEEAVISQEERAVATDALASAFNRTCQKLGHIQAARKLLVLQILLNIREGGARKVADYDLAQIAQHINRPTKEITARWSALWLDLDLGRFGISREWADVRDLFSPPVAQEELGDWYEFYMNSADWVTLSESE